MSSNNRGFSNSRANIRNVGNNMKGTGMRLYNQFSQAPRNQQVLSIVVTLLVLVLVVYLIVKLVGSYNAFHTNNIKIVPGTVRLDEIIKVSGQDLPKSVDRSYGIEFSYAGWHYIKTLNSSSDTVAKTSLRHIYRKGSAHINPSGNIKDGTIGPVQAPGVWIDSATNRLHILMNTFPESSGSSFANAHVFDDAIVENVPMRTWFHLAIVCINKNIDIFINGRLKMRKALNGIPRLNYGDLFVGGDSYNGYLSNLYYFSHALQVFELDRLVAEGPSAVLFKTPKYNEAQLAQDWYLTTQSNTTSN